MKPLHKWRKQNAKKLADFITDHTSLNFVEFSGFLTAIISGPSVYMPSQWLTMIDYKPPVFDSLDEAESCMRLIMTYYNDIAHKLRHGKYQPLAAFGICQPITECDERVLPLLADWVRGYLYLVHADIDAWNKGGDTVSKLLAPLISSELTDEELQDVLNENGATVSLKEARHLPGQILAALIDELYIFWFEYRMNAHDHTHQHDEHCQHDHDHGPAQIPKPNYARNEPCPCGSGKKYKKCCWIETIH